MARVIVILTLLVLITSGIFYLTRHASEPSRGNERTTVSLPDGRSPKDDDRLSASTAQDLVGRPVAGAAPVLATVGVDGTGKASLTGTAAPGSRVEVLRDGEKQGEGLAGQDGSWTVGVKVSKVQKPFSLIVRSTASGSGYVEGPQIVLVTPPERRGGLPGLKIVAALNAQAKSPADASTDVLPEPGVGIIIEGVDAAESGEVRLSGRADPGATLRLEMAGRAAGRSRVGADGRWSLKARNTTGAEVLAVRVVLESAAGVQIDASMLPLRLPAVSLALPAKPQLTRTARSGKGGWIRVRRGDSLWKIARRHYGDGSQWTRILKANRKRISNPDLILPGWRLRLP